MFLGWKWKRSALFFSFRWSCFIPVVLTWLPDVHYSQFFSCTHRSGFPELFLQLSVPPNVNTVKTACGIGQIPPKSPKKEDLLHLLWTNPLIQVIMPRNVTILCDRGQKLKKSQSEVKTWRVKYSNRVQVKAQHIQAVILLFGQYPVCVCVCVTSA